MLVFVVFFVTLAGALLPPFALKEIAYVYFVAAMAGAAAENKVVRRMMDRIRDNKRHCFFIIMHPFVNDSINHNTHHMRYNSVLLALLVYSVF